ncbi:MAG: potassium-transporting ATPase subunit F [Bacteroidetes bacterium GWA2_40_14]|jgi:K+-transporting ATPase KdpF subunit|nr:MAG: potassium-transporting ATPase subunit F [Bacteroidetes bacterium GWA2_40_14]OFX61761.1 MAG: potassium-transporting ATPase subunit F [Bacteroidetes bacterium GWC2_40_13]OFY18843.1 MAG: potassium-transporting ATPase subunit F [Bacteroidetes bacterium GWF2_40_13]OFZ24818.1 MAG: potassium-transporting ATPase subunit F [Bacteroidetes bacterium RIFOXYC2_FULL_40_12]
MIAMDATILLTTSQTLETDNSAGYVTGVIIALFILGYLLYSLVKPEKF